MFIQNVSISENHHGTCSCWTTLAEILASIEITKDPGIFTITENN